MRPWLAVVILFSAPVWLLGCSAEHYRESADRAAYSIIAFKQRQALGEETHFTIETSTESPLEETLNRVGSDLAEADDPSAIKLTLAQAVETAALHSRECQAQKESLYLSALSLSGTRALYRPLFSGLLSGLWTKEDEEQEVSADSSFGCNWLLTTGGTIAASVTTSILRVVSGADTWSSASVLSLSLTQPFWRGSAQARETLTQAERDMIYATRSFARYRTTFAVNIASSYYRVLQSEDGARNAEDNYEGARRSSEVAQALAEAGRRPRFEADQARQNELRARAGLISARQSYEEALDDFKITLGLPVDARVRLDHDEIERLRELTDPRLGLEQAITIAQKRRLDYLNVVGQVDDATRKVEVARVNLGPDLGLDLRASIPTDVNRPLAFRADDGSYSAGLDLGLPLNRVSERNSYRGSLIALDKSRRDLSLARDNLIRDARRAWRRLNQARESYEIQAQSLALAKRRVESTELLIEAGRAVTRDLLDAQSDYLSAQNAVTAALVGYQQALLEFWRDTGVLSVDENGNWVVSALDVAEESSDADRQ